MTFYIDSDGDGYGNPAFPVLACTAPAGTVNNNLDCDDTDPNINPSAPEICDGVDNNCSGQVDDAIACLCPSGLQTNTFLGNTIFWTDASNWSLGTVPTLCDHVIIPAGLAVILLSSESGECFTLHVINPADFEIQSGAVLEVVAPG